MMKHGKYNSEKLEAELEKRNIIYISYNKYIEYIKDIELIQYKDSNEMLVKNKGQFVELIKHLYELAKNIKLEAYNKGTIANYLNTFIEKTKTEIYKPISTGYLELNKALGGGIVNQSIVNIGGASSVGKTAFALQILKNMMKQHKVIYYSLEMSVEQILSRILSSVIWDTKHYNTLHITPNKILQGYERTAEEKEAINLAMEIIKEDARNLTIINPQNPRVEEIIKEAEKVKCITGEAPILFIDYIQLLQGNIKEDMQTIIKNATRKLKKYAIDNNTIIYIISAFNREANKNKEATMESGRDTSDLEYSSDYMLALNLTEYEKGNKTIDIDDLKGKNIRDITVKVLKNRMGTTGAKIMYEFITENQAYKEVGRINDNYTASIKKL